MSHPATDDGRRLYTQRQYALASLWLTQLIGWSSWSARPALRYRSAAEDILRCLLTFRDPSGKLAYLAKDSPHRGVLAAATVSWSLPQISLMFGDYYLLEALSRYRLLPGPRTP